MSKKFYGLLLPALAILAFASMGGAAQAAKFEICTNAAGHVGKFETHACKLPEVTGGTFGWLVIGETKQAVVTHGTLTLHALGITITCTVKDAGVIWNNSAGEGRDEITVFTNEKCKASNEEAPPKGCPTPTIEALGLPWQTALVAGTPIRDKIAGIQVELACAGSAVGVFEGSLTPEIVNGSPTEAVFGAGSGELEEPIAKLKATVTGSDAMELANGWAVRVHS
ncbi:MAG: hypothetical protein ACRDLF_02545 [Solirubrobacteraceae bacterium]